MKSLKEITDYLIKEGTALRDKYFFDIPMNLDYICIFSQNEEEFDFYNKEALKIGNIAEDTPTGKVYSVNKEFRSVYKSKLIKIRIVDTTRTQRGDLDFAVDQFEKYKERLLKHSTNLIKRETFEMIEIIDKDFDSLLYFSNPPVSKVLKIK